MWILIKRILIFLFGLIAVAWAVFVSIKTLVAGLIGLFGILMLGVVFAIGLFAMYCAIKGSDEDIRSFNLWPY
ncbi:hypothetical protein Pan258_50610 [Symmachiella dynata]|uniref:hypothetical protein n=1 Tax=Symmachiella dynata TaxID=2527995 RepID=UPI001188D91B|nr:hypothetical protein [Symmachiella dynata]QDT50978.1 hypothetical protein Pan258_50610 [Symmachiella dynata]